MKGNFNTFVKNKNMKKNVDCEIYISQLVTFFETNPNDLLTLIGDIQKEEFYTKLREKSEDNHKKGLDIILNLTLQD